MLQDDLMGQIAKHVIDNRAVPMGAFLIDTDALMGRAEGEQGVDTEAGASLDHSTGNEASL